MAYFALRTVCRSVPSVWVRHQHLKVRSLMGEVANAFSLMQFPFWPCLSCTSLSCSLSFTSNIDHNVSSETNFKDLLGGLETILGCTEADITFEITSIMKEFLWDLTGLPLIEFPINCVDSRGKLSSFHITTSCYKMKINSIKTMLIIFVCYKQSPCVFCFHKVNRR